MWMDVAVLSDGGNIIPEMRQGKINAETLI